MAAPVIHFAPKLLPFIDPYSDEGFAISTFTGYLVAVAFIVGTLAYGGLAIVGLSVAPGARSDHPVAQR